MKLEFGSKSLTYDSGGHASATKVILTNAEGAVVPVNLPAESIDLSNTELLELALEVVYEENFPQRAENEKFNTLGEKIAKFDDMMEKMQEAIKQSQQANEENHKLVKTVSLTINEVLAMVYSEEETEEAVNEEPTQED
ncbi:DUF1366 domain-containing protein [Streptococcus thoraltensis]|uniref:DUF1366 domain-containing protein n=1 Tax=Streptococcus thoraltensis TaxID=55085 RepID=UPI001F5A8FE5|nr:DUF1366 domain-containing protein [Streptococcus thoraltensis]